MRPMKAEEPGMLELVQADTSARCGDARKLMSEYLEWHHRHHAEDRQLVDLYFDQAAFEAELAGLPGRYATPTGSLLLAYLDGTPVGCAGLRDLGGGVCEMKRLYVQDNARGLGIGQRLAETLIEHGRAAGHRHMRLDTSIRQHDAIRLYYRLGFVVTGLPYPVPEPLRGWLVFFQLDLSREPSSIRAGSSAIAPIRSVG